MRISRGAVSAVVPLVCTISLLALPAPARAQVDMGVEGAVSSEYDFGVGGRLLAQAEDLNLDFVGRFDYYLPDGPGDAWELGADLFYHFHLETTRSVLPYLGGGLNVSRITGAVDDTNAGLELGAGVRFPLANVTPYVEGRGVLGDADHLSLSVGFFLGHAHVH